MNATNQYTESISTWQQFRHITEKSDDCLLERLSDFPHSLLISGCQRSGTTMLSRIIRDSPEIVDHSFGRDDELDGALILSGLVDHEPLGRYCFQTTYVDNNYYEYFDHQSSFKIIWVLRNPLSTVYSLVYNWGGWHLDHTFRDSAESSLNGIDRLVHRYLGIRAISHIKRACYIYNWKLSHLFYLYPRFNKDEIMIVDYDDLVKRKEVVLPEIISFSALNLWDDCGDSIHSGSLDKGQQLSFIEKRTVDSMCKKTYLKAQQFTDKKGYPT